MAAVFSSRLWVASAHCEGFQTMERGAWPHLSMYHWLTASCAFRDACTRTGCCVVHWVLYIHLIPCTSILCGSVKDGQDGTLSTSCTKSVSDSVTVPALHAFSSPLTCLWKNYEIYTRFCVPIIRTERVDRLYVFLHTCCSEHTPLDASFCKYIHDFHIRFHLHRCRYRATIQYGSVHAKKHLQPDNHHVKVCMHVSKHTCVCAYVA